MPDVEYLGIIIKEGHVTMDPAKLKAIDEWNPPTSVKGVHSFIGFCNFYRWFIPDFFSIACPLHDLTKKGVVWNWSPSCQTAFLSIKGAFTHQPILAMLNVFSPFFLMTDASLTMSGGVLMQKDGNGDLHPCTYLSKTFSPAKWNYNIYDGEFLAVIHALEEWRHYLLGMVYLVIVMTDHKNLLYFRQPWKLSQRQAYWNFFLQDFDLRFDYVPSPQMGLADALSCLDDVDISDTNADIVLLPGDLFACTIDVTLAEKLTHFTEADPLVQTALQPWTRAPPSFLKPGRRIGSSGGGTDCTLKGISMC